MINVSAFKMKCPRDGVELEIKLERKLIERREV